MPLLAACAAGGSAQAQIRAALDAPAPPLSTAEFDVYLPLRDPAGLDRLLERLHTPGTAEYHHWLTPAQFARRYGAAPEVIGRASAALRAEGLDVSVTGSHSLRAQGPVAVVERTLKARLHTGHYHEGAPRLIAESPPVLPAALAEAGAVIAHFAPVQHMRTHSAVAGTIGPGNRTGATGNYWFTDLKQAYSWPSFTVANGSGVNIGILMAGNYSPPDMFKYFGHENLPVPNIGVSLIFGGTAFNAQSGGCVEAELDLQQSGGMAPNAKITLFSMPDLSDSAILAGLTQIVEGNAVDVVSMSFGAPEIGYTAPYSDGVDYTPLVNAYDGLFKQGVSQGITFVASSGDGGALPTPQSACFAANAAAGCGVMIRSAEFPASSTSVTGVGGTNLVTGHSATTLSSPYASEAAFYDPLASDSFYNTPAYGAIWGSGGGLSIFFAQPSYQTNISSISNSKRMVPDVALHMGGCPGNALSPCGPNRSGDTAYIGGVLTSLVGTSAAAPDFAGLMALRVQLTHGRLGNENYHLYALARAQAAGAKPPVFRTTIQGNNGYKTVPGYNVVLGNGTVYGNAYLGVANQPAAGIPQTPSNP